MKGLGEGLLVGRVVLVGLPLLVRTLEEAPQEPLAQRVGRSVHLLPRLRVVAVEHDAARFAQVAGDDTRSGNPADIAKHGASKVRLGQAIGMHREMPQSDQPVRLAAPHRLIEPPHGPRPRGC